MNTPCPCPPNHHRTGNVRTCPACEETYCAEPSCARQTCTNCDAIALDAAAESRVDAAIAMARRIAVDPRMGEKATVGVTAVWSGARPTSIAHVVSIHADAEPDAMAWAVEMIGGAQQRLDYSCDAPKRNVSAWEGQIDGVPVVVYASRKAPAPVEADLSTAASEG